MKNYMECVALICLFSKHRASVCHERTEIPLLMRAQGDKGKLYPQKAQQQPVDSLL